MPNAVLDCKHEKSYTYWDAFYGKRLWECPVCFERLEK
jgi:hypothetical protein